MGFTSLPIKWAGKAAKPLYHTFRQKDTGDAKSRTFLQRKGSVFVQPLSLASLDSSPSRGASGETVHFAGTAKASPFGRGVTEGDGEGKPGRKEPLRSDGQALCQSDAIAVPELFVSGLALSVSSQAPRQLPQRGSHWHVGQLSSGRAKHNISETAVLRCLVQRQLDKERCPEAAAPVSKARPLASCRASVVQWKVTRPAKGSPSGGAVTPSARLRGLREFVENARLKRKEFVNVIKMRRRY